MNKLVLLIPVSVMFLLFYLGYQYISSSEAITNESLQQKINIELHSEKGDATILLSANWDWTQMPQDGLVGNDYIVITIHDENGIPLEQSKLLDHSLVLLKGSSTLMEIPLELIEGGFLFSVPNELVEHESYGNRGHLQIQFSTEGQEKYTATIAYAHTWKEHNQLEIVNTVEFEEKLRAKLPNNYWIVKRLIEL